MMYLHIKSIFAVGYLQSVVVCGWGRSPLKSSTSLLFVQHWGCKRWPTRVLEVILQATNTFFFSLYSKTNRVGQYLPLQLCICFSFFFIRVRYPKSLVEAKGQMSSQLSLCFLFTSQNPQIKYLQINSSSCVINCYFNKPAQGKRIAELSRKNSHRAVFRKHQPE